MQFRLEALKDITEEVAAERIRLGRLSHALDPDVCTSTGFATCLSWYDLVVLIEGRSVVLRLGK